MAALLSLPQCGKLRIQVSLLTGYFSRLLVGVWVMMWGEDRYSSWNSWDGDHVGVYEIDRESKDGDGEGEMKMNRERGRGWGRREWKKYRPEDGNPQPALSKKQVSQCIHEISKCHWVLKMTVETRSTIRLINRFHAPTKVNGYTKYDQVQLNIVCSWVLMRIRSTYGQTDGQRDGWINRWWRAWMGWG